MLADVLDAATLLVKIAWIFVGPLFWSAIAFALIALALKGRDALDAARQAAKETRITLGLYAVDLLLVGAPLGIAVALIAATVRQYGLVLTGDPVWSGLGGLLTLLVTVFLGDFISYWRHRLEHTRWLWPAHAIHHSDTQMTWLTGNRFHPVDRLVTAVVDNAALALLGVPVWAVAANELIRHYYGEFLHADLPWTYGRLGSIFVSPAMHRWHHARDVTGSGSNFATVFSVFDRAFGSAYVPGPCTAPLGVREHVGDNSWRQLAHPFMAWARQVSRARARASRPARIEVPPSLAGSHPGRDA